jgi:hypothetical protein
VVAGTGHEGERDLLARVWPWLCDIYMSKLTKLYTVNVQSIMSYTSNKAVKK